jgi:hypothetical protein
MADTRYPLCRICWRASRFRNPNYPVSLKELGSYIGLTGPSVRYMVKQLGWNAAMDYYEKKYNTTDLPRA